MYFLWPCFSRSFLLSHEASALSCILNAAAWEKPLFVLPSQHPEFQKQPSISKYHCSISRELWIKGQVSLPSYRLTKAWEMFLQKGMFSATFLWHKIRMVEAKQLYVVSQGSYCRPKIQLLEGRGQGRRITSSKPARTTEWVQGLIWKVWVRHTSKYKSKSKSPGMGLWQVWGRGFKSPAQQNKNK